MTIKTQTWGRFEISIADHVKEISLTVLPSHQRDRKTISLRLSCLNGELWLVSCFGWTMRCKQQILATLSQWMGQSLMQQTGTKSEHVGQHATQHECSCVKRHEVRPSKKPDRSFQEALHPEHSVLVPSLWSSRARFQGSR